MSKDFEAAHSMLDKANVPDKFRHSPKSDNDYWTITVKRSNIGDRIYYAFRLLFDWIN